MITLLLEEVIEQWLNPGLFDAEAYAPPGDCAE